MNANHILDALELIDDKLIAEAREHGGMAEKSKKARSIRHAPAIAAAIAALLALCGFAAYELGWFDPWLQTPSASPVETVRSAVEHQIDKDYTIAVRIEEIKVDDAETRRVSRMYSGSEFAQARGWTDDYLAKHFVVVWASYYAEYDHTKTFLNDGPTQQYFYLTQDVETGAWSIIDNTSPET